MSPSELDEALRALIQVPGSVLAAFMKLMKLTEDNLKLTESKLADHQRQALAHGVLIGRTLRQLATEVQALKLALEHRGVVTPEDLDAAERDLAAGVAVEAALDPELQATLETWRRLEAELDREPDETP